jgi:hypothetical protein
MTSVACRIRDGSALRGSERNSANQPGDGVLIAATKIDVLGF